MEAVVDFHSYAATNADLVPLLSSVTNTPIPKKGKSEPSLSKLQENIVTVVAEKIRESTTTLHR